MITRECDVENIADFARYYGTSFVGWHDRAKGQVTPAYVGRLDGSKIQVRFITKGNNSYTPGEMEYYEFRDLKENIDFGRPRLGILEDGPSIIFLSQTTPREPKKGLRIRDARRIEFNSWDTRKYVAQPNPYSERFDWIWHAFNPNFAPFKECVEKLHSGDRVGTALSSDIGLYTVPQSLYPLVAFKRWTVGYVRNEILIALHPSFADYEQELRQVTGAEVTIL